MICGVIYLLDFKMININCAISNYLRGDDYQKHSRTLKLCSLITFYYKLFAIYTNQVG